MPVRLLQEQLARVGHKISKPHCSLAPELLDCYTVSEKDMMPPCGNLYVLPLGSGLVLVQLLIVKVSLNV